MHVAKKGVIQNKLHLAGCYLPKNNFTGGIELTLFIPLRRLENLSEYGRKVKFSLLDEMPWRLPLDDEDKID